MSQALKTKSVNVNWISKQKGTQKITMLTAYDFPTAKYLDSEGIDLILVGDSVGTVIYGHTDTLAVTLEDMIRHGQAVARAAERSMVIVDLPFLSYQISIERAIENAGRIMKETGAQAVKLEGGVDMEFTISALTRIGIPVCAHIGLTPQSVHADGGYRTHGKTPSERELLIESAEAVQRAGAFAVVLECVQKEVAAEITDLLKIPTIGIGSGNACDGQVLVSHDLVGLTPGRTPKFVEPVADLKTPFKKAIADFVHRTKANQTSAPAPLIASPPPAPPSLSLSLSPSSPSPQVAAQIPGLAKRLDASKDIRLTRKERS